MKTMIVGLLAAVALSGCVAVPYDPGPGAYYGGGPGYGPGYYGPPAPVYYGPPVSFSFGYTYRDGYRRGHRHWR